MSEPFLAEIRIFGFNFPPRGWAQCDGQLLPIAQNSALFSLLGTTFGGDGRTTFGLPGMRGRAPVNSGGNSAGPGLTARPLGQKSGQETVQLTVGQMPSHGHTQTPAVSTDAATATTPAGNLPATVVPGFNVYGDAAGLTTGGGALVTNAGDNSAHINMQPSLAVNFCIALQGIFPSRN